MASAMAAGAGMASGSAVGGSNGPLYQVAAVDQGLNLEPETLSFWGYDDGTAVLLVVKGGLVFAYDMAPQPPGQAGPPGGPDQLKWTFPLADGPPVRRLRLSLDGGLLALQRGGRLLELVELATGNVFVQGTDKTRGDLITFFFTELPGAEVVLVTPAGLEMYEFVGARRQGLRLKERIRMPIEWAIYTHETRMVLLGTATGGVSYIKAFQFVTTGLVVLPPFTAGAAASALALMGVPAATGGGGVGGGANGGGGGGVSVTGLGLGLVGDVGGGGLVGVGSAAVAAVGGLAASPAAAAAVATPPVRVPPENLRLIKVYGRVYCVHINRRSLKLELYRFYTDTVVLQYTYELFSPHVDVAVVDAVIVVVAQQPPAGSGPGSGSAAASGSGYSAGLGVAMLYDVAAHSGQPVANPLPVRVLRFYSGPGAPPDMGAGGELAAGATAASGDSRRFDFLAPNVVLDRTAQTVYRLALNLPAVVESCSDAAVLAGFLQRRRGGLPPALALAAAAPPGSDAAAAQAAAAAAAQPKALLLGVVRNALQERMPMATVRAIFDDLCAGYAAALDRELLAAALAPPPPPSAAAAVPPGAAAGGSAAGAAQPPSAVTGAAAGAAGAGAGAGAAGALPLPPLPPPPPGSVPMPAYVTPEELAGQLFRWLHDEEVVDAPYLQAALSEYMAAAVGAGIPLPAYLQELSVEVMMQQAQLLQPHLQAGQVLQLLYSQAQYVAPEVVDKVVAALAATAASSAATANGAASAAASAAAAGDGPELDPAGGAAGSGSSGSSSGAGTGAGTSAVARLARQLELDELGRTALAARYESPVAPHIPYYHSPAAAAAARSGPAAAFGAAATPGGGGGDAAAYVAALLAGGDVLRAARVMKRYRVSKPTVREFVTAVGARGDAAALAAVYRVFQDELLSAYPKYELAARMLLPPGAAAAAGIPDRPAAPAAARA